MTALRLRRPACFALDALVGAAATFVALPAHEAEAVPSGGVLGTWKLRLKIDGFGARAADGASGVPTVEFQKVPGDAVLFVRPRDAQVNDGIVTIEVSLDAASAGTILGRATPGTPAFRGTAAIVGEAFAAIDAGQPNYVNAITLRFDRGGKKLTGTWMAVFPASEASIAQQKFASGVTATIVGRRTARTAPR